MLAARAAARGGGLPPGGRAERRPGLVLLLFRGPLPVLPIGHTQKEMIERGPQSVGLQGAQNRVENDLRGRRKHRCSKRNTGPAENNGTISCRVLKWKFFVI